MKKLILASRNENKVEELTLFLSDMNLEVLSLSNFPAVPQVAEDGATFQENALKKARAIYEVTKIPSLADDSGLEVFFLNGRPGVRSARYAGDYAKDEENNEKLLGEMLGVPPRRRRAQFRCVLALVGSGFEDLTEGICMGNLAEVPRGTNGFGYDPVFIPDDFSRTYAELRSDEKNKISHRARAFRELTKILRDRFV
ncbi:MAG: XTP/dITP diphosphatase [Bacteroidetes bacterium]|nr:XTP/dITP diphosphatase [Bacteroidota bacterium]